MGSGGECAKQLEQHVQSPGSLLQLHNYVLVVSSPDRAHPWSLASLAALGTGANLEQVRRNSSPLSTTATLVGNLFISMKTVNAGALGAPLWIGEDHRVVLLVPSCEVGCGLAPCPRHPAHPSATSCCHELLLAGPQNRRPLRENSSQASGMSSHARRARVPAGPCPL